MEKNWGDTPSATSNLIFTSMIYDNVKSILNEYVLN